MNKTQIFDSTNHHLVDPKKNTAIIIDIDGTISDCKHRLHFINGEKKDWDGFYSEIHKDKANEWCKQLVNIYYRVPHIFVLLVTGRSEKYKEETIKWLSDNGIDWWGIHFRKENDYRPDYEVKKELYETILKKQYNVLFAIDDRSQVVQMWREQGIPCLQCADGNY